MTFVARAPLIQKLYCRGETKSSGGYYTIPKLDLFQFRYGPGPRHSL